MQKTILMIVAVVMGQSVFAADEVVITDLVVKEAIGKLLKKPYGKFVPPIKLTEEEVAKVTVLSLYDTKITDAGLKDLAKLEKLTDLHLGRTKITDAGLFEIVKMKQLKNLFLDYTQITDAGLFEIVKMKQLASLNLIGCKQITAKDVVDLRMAMPKCRIFF